MVMFFAHPKNHGISKNRWFVHPGTLRHTGSVVHLFWRVDPRWFLWHPTAKAPKLPWDSGSPQRFPVVEVKFPGPQLGGPQSIKIFRVESMNPWMSKHPEGWRCFTWKWWFPNKLRNLLFPKVDLFFRDQNKHKLQRYLDFSTVGGWTNAS